MLSTSFSPDGKQLATGSGDTTVRFWDLSTCTPEKTMKVQTLAQRYEGPAAVFQCIATATFPLYIAALHCCRSCHVDTTSAHTHRDVWLQGHKNWVLCVAWSPDAKYLVSGSMDGQILVWQADSGKLKGTCRVTFFPRRSCRTLRSCMAERSCKSDGTLACARFSTAVCQSAWSLPHLHKQLY